MYVDKELREDDKTYQDLFSDMYLHLKPEQLQSLGDEVKDVYNALKRLRERTIEINTEEVWMVTSWILKAKHHKKTNTYEVLVSSEILEYLVELASQFTEYSLTVAISLKSTYSQRFYEWCCQYKNKGKFFLEVDRLRYLLKIEDKKSYENTFEIKRRILDTAQKELQELFEAGQSDLYFTYRVKDSDKKKILFCYPKFRITTGHLFRSGCTSYAVSSNRLSTGNQPALPSYRPSVSRGEESCGRTPHKADGFRASLPLP